MYVRVCVQYLIGLKIYNDKKGVVLTLELGCHLYSLHSPKGYGPRLFLFRTPGDLISELELLGGYVCVQKVLG